MKYEKVVFLDIDGVLNSESGEDMRILDPKAVALLKKLIEKHRAVIVVSSVWRKLDWPNRIIKAFKKAGWEQPPIVDRTPILCSLRGEEIKLWLSQNDVEVFVIIDDDTDMLPEQLNNFIRCHTDYGLTKKQIEAADRIFNRKTRP